MKLGISVHRGLEGMKQLSPEWTRLTNRLPEPGFHRSLACYEALIRHRRNDASAVHFVCLRGPSNELLAICPLEIATRRVRRITLQCWQFPSDPDRPASDFICDPGVEPAAIMPALVSALRGLNPRVGLMALDKVEEESDAWNMLVSCNYSSTRVVPGGEILRVGTRNDFDSLLAATTPKFRSNLRRRRKILDQVGKTEFMIIRDGADVLGALDRFLELEASGWKGVDARGNAIARDSKRLEYVRRMVPALAATGNCELHLLMNGHVCVAAGICIIGGKEAYLFKTAYAESYSKASPGQLLVQHMLEEFCGRPDVSRFNVGWEAHWFEPWAPLRSRISSLYVGLGGLRARLAMGLLAIPAGRRTG